MTLRALAIGIALFLLPVAAHGQDEAAFNEDLREGCLAGAAIDCELLGASYYFGTDGLEQDLQRALGLYARACSAGRVRSCTNLGRMYHRGEGVVQDYSRAATLFHQACNGGYANGCYNLAITYHFGEGVMQDYVRAHALYNLAASQGDETARSSRDLVAQRMTPQQRADAQALARHCSETGIPACLQ